MIIYSNFNPLQTEEMCQCRRRAYDIIFFSFLSYCTINVYLQLIEPQLKGFWWWWCLRNGSLVSLPTSGNQNRPKILQVPNFRKMWHVLGVRRQATAKWKAETVEKWVAKGGIQKVCTRCVESLAAAFNFVNLILIIDHKLDLSEYLTNENSRKF